MSTASLVDSYWACKTCVSEDQGKLHEYKEFTCSFCEYTGKNLSPRKRLAHLCGIKGVNILTCTQSVKEIPEPVMRKLLPLIKEGRDRLQEEAEVQGATVALKKARQKHLPTLLSNGHASKAAEYFSRAHHTMGNVPDRLWANEWFLKGLQELVKLPPDFVYKAPTPKQFAVEFLIKETERVDSDKGEVLADCDVATGSMDGWDNMVKTHWLLQSLITEKGPSFFDSKDMTNVQTIDAAKVVSLLNEFLDAVQSPLNATNKLRMNAIVLDTPSVHRSALRQFEAQHPCIVALYCVLHIINLFFKDVFSKIPSLRDLWGHVNQTVLQFRRTRFLREALLAAQEEDPTVMEACKGEGPGTSQAVGYIGHAKTRCASKYMVCERAKRVNPAARVVVASAKFAVRYEQQTAEDKAADSDDDLVPREKRKKSAILADSKGNFIQSNNQQSLLDATVDILRSSYKLMKLVDSDKLCIGKVWRRAWQVWQGLKAAEDKDGRFVGVASLWYTRWREFHHPAMSLAYVLMPEYWASRPWSEPEVAADSEKMLQRYFPETEDRSLVLVALGRYKARTGPFRLYTPSGVKNAIWEDACIVRMSPWSWWDEVLSAVVLHNMDDLQMVRAYANLRKCARDVLRIGVAAGCTERMFSGWQHILGTKRLRMSRKRQRNEMNILVSDKLLRYSGEEFHADCDSSSDSSSEEDDMPLSLVFGEGCVS